MKSDSVLLSEYAGSGSAEAGSEIARRHWPMVYAACRRILGNDSDAEDAAQATFLVLVRRAASIRDPANLAPWLHGVAVRASRKVAFARVRRQQREKEGAAMSRSAATEEGPDWGATAAEMDAAVETLPSSMRRAVILHCLEGCSQSEVARQIGCPEGSAATWIRRGIEKLRARLSRRGVSVPAGAFGAYMKGLGAAAAAVPLPAAVERMMAGGADAAAHVERIAEEIMRDLLLTKLKVVGAAVAALALLVVASAMLARPAIRAGDASPAAGPGREEAAPVQGPAVAPGKGPRAEGPPADDLKARFAKYYKPVKADFVLKAPQYALPLAAEKLSNAGVAATVLKDGAIRDTFCKQGFVAYRNGRLDDVAAFYKGLKDQGLPIFVTSDSLLHLYHAQFDETLKDVEEREFFNDALSLSKAMFDWAADLEKSSAGETKEAARRLVAYFGVALECLAKETQRARLLEMKKEVESVEDDWQLHEIAAKYEEQAKELQKLGRIEYRKGPLLSLLARAIEARKADRIVSYAIPGYARDLIARELALMERHEGFEVSPIFAYKEDYSQYVPRGHYTRSENLKKYFCALMWYGRLTFLLKGHDEFGPEIPPKKALVSPQEAKVQTIAGALAAMALTDVKLAGGRSAKEAWERLYAVTAYFVGLADDLTPAEYAWAAGKSGSAKAGDVERNYPALRLHLAKLRPPGIYGGTGAVVVPRGSGEQEFLDALAVTRGFRFMGQRYVPDSYMMGKLVFPSVGPWAGGPPAFTTGQGSRVFPRGLDVMAVLGSKRARAILGDLKDDNYKAVGDSLDYDSALEQLQKEFSPLTEADWNRNCYFSWLYVLKALLKDSYEEGYPTFMRQPAWVDKQMNAALASWSQLRHDTILYAKQSHGQEKGEEPPPPQMVEGYVEPVPEFYARLLALTRMTLAGLDDMKALDATAKSRLQELEKTVEKLLVITRKELAAQALTAEEYDFIRNFGDRMAGIVAGVNSEGLQTTIVADVHTDQNTRQVLEEGTGHLRPMLVAYPMPDGGVVLGAGPIFSYYEFKHPMGDRLTDEKWKRMLRERKAPPPPSWVSTFAAE